MLSCMLNLSEKIRMSLRDRMAHSLNVIWQSNRLCWLLAIFVPVLQLIAYARKKLHYPSKNKIPVCVVGNISVGGNGKTPFVAWLAECLIAQHYRVVIAGKPYCASRPIKNSQIFTETYPVNQMGDEMALLGHKLRCSIVVAPSRSSAINFICTQHKGEYDIILCDDGLQSPDILPDCSILLCDPDNIGNGYLLPMGPLRMPWECVNDVDFFLSVSNDLSRSPGVLKKMSEFVYHHHSLQKVQLRSFESVIAILGVAKPEPIQKFLTQYIADITWIIKSDHTSPTSIQLEYIRQKNKPILMTEKDWIKIKDELTAEDNVWIIPLKIEIEKNISLSILKYIEGLCRKGY